MKKDSNGRFLSGSMPEEWRQKISEGQRRRHARVRQLQEEAGVAVDKKRCTRCGEWKRVNLEDASDSDFTIRRRTLKSGEVRKYPAPDCKKCAARRRREWEKGLGKEQVRARQQKWNANRDKKAKRRYNREWGRIRRIEQGVTPRGPWKRYRSEVPGRDGLRLDPGPLLQEIDGLWRKGTDGWDDRNLDRMRQEAQKPRAVDIGESVGISRTKILDIMRGKRTMLPHEAEVILRYFDREHRFLELYPEAGGDGKVVGAGGR